MKQKKSLSGVKTLFYMWSFTQTSVPVFSLQSKGHEKSKLPRMLIRLLFLSASLINRVSNSAVRIRFKQKHLDQVYKLGCPAPKVLSSGANIINREKRCDVTSGSKQILFTPAFSTWICKKVYILLHNAWSKARFFSVN